MEGYLFTNISVYKSIADESYKKMNDYMDEGRKTLPNGGFVVRVDPDQRSFKQAMITIIFSAMWIEAFLHQLLAIKFGVETTERHDRKNYEKKLELLGITDQAIITQVTKFREARNFMVHEKAYSDPGEIYTAQSEAENAYRLRKELEIQLS